MVIGIERTTQDDANKLLDTVWHISLWSDAPDVFAFVRAPNSCFCGPKLVA